MSRESGNIRFNRFENENSFTNFRKILKEQEDKLCELMIDHKQEVESFVKEKTRKFRKKPLQKQFEFLDEISVKI